MKALEYIDDLRESGFSSAAMVEDAQCGLAVIADYVEENWVSASTREELYAQRRMYVEALYILTQSMAHARASDLRAGFNNARGPEFAQ